MEINGLVLNIDYILLFKLLSDFGLFVLIWIVQLIIYPSFQYYAKEDLIKWHHVYTQRITIVVLPLMLGQLVLSFWLLYDNYRQFYEVVNIILVVLTWATTFSIFVPLHNNISKATAIQQTTSKLIHWNWMRTLIWSLVLILTFFKIL